MFEFENSVIIYQPVEKVFNFATELNNNPKWQSDIIAVEQVSDGLFGQGATCRLVNRFLGQRYESEFVISDYQPHHKCSYQFLSGPVIGQSSFIFETVNGNGCTKFTTKGQLKLAQFKLASFLVKRKANQQIRDDMKRLKRILENSNGA